MQLQTFAIFHCVACQRQWNTNVWWQYVYLVIRSIKIVFFFCLFPGVYIRVMGMIELYYISLVYLVSGTHILFVLVLSRKGSFGFQVLDWAVLSMSARINDEDDVPLVIVSYNGAH